MKRKERAAETEAALKAAAKRVFAERGYLNTKIADITAEAGRAAGSFYNHFAGKEALLEALLADMATEGDSAASAPGHLSDFTDPEAVRQHIEVSVRLYREHAATIRAVQEAALVSENFAGTLARFAGSEMADILGHVTCVTDAGRRLPAPPETALRMVYSLVHAFLQIRRQPADALSDEEVTEALTRFVYRGLNGCDF
ncbi:TetR/AcrR family transcriptional regulator [Actinoallomurus soli]|uniref:TetR/AcrR family transcriptional regulator n=1 Tax=Actinoallomurus soli TaxID=2952535 RepID=UPI002093B15A|nr:TetR/AcrR family transcriptional regulator [Actinoallomurus soli]MCO5969288.1 TetR/AcrR family transcriptional regulator [Actinoallomurus soli]